MEVIMRRNTASLLFRTIGNSSFIDTLRSSRYLCQLNDTRWVRKINDKNVSRKNISCFFSPISSSTICSTNKFLIANLSSTKYLVSYYSTASSNDTSKVCSTTEQPKKLSIIGKMKQLYRDYWRILVPVHLVTSVGWAAIFWTAAKNGVDILQIMEYLHISEKYIELIKNSNAGDFAVTYALYKIFTPLRYTVTVGGTTLIIKSLDKLGYHKYKRRSTETTQLSNKSSSSNKETSSENTSTKCFVEDKQRKV